MTLTNYVTCLLVNSVTLYKNHYNLVEKVYILPSNYHQIDKLFHKLLIVRI
jgi:hypothetical protein